MENKIEFYMLLIVYWTSLPTTFQHHGKQVDFIFIFFYISFKEEL